MEKCLIEVTLSSDDQRLSSDMDLDNCLIKHIRGLAMQISRFKPADWNKFLDVVIK